MIKRDELASPNSCLNKARDDEMVFVLLGRDVAAAPAIRAWCEERVRLGKNKPDDPQILEAEACADAITQPTPVSMVGEFTACVVNGGGRSMLSHGCFDEAVFIGARHKFMARLAARLFNGDPLLPEPHAVAEVCAKIAETWLDEKRPDTLQTIVEEIRRYAKDLERVSSRLVQAQTRSERRIANDMGLPESLRTDGQKDG